MLLSFNNHVFVYKALNKSREQKKCTYGHHKNVEFTFSHLSQLLEDEVASQTIYKLDILPYNFFTAIGAFASCQD